MTDVTPYPPDFLLDRLLYRDGLILVINKPAGLPVHARPGSHQEPGVSKGPKDDNLEYYFDALRFGLPRKPVLAHRLDRDTSGCLVLARHPKAARKMGKLFQEGRVKKTYWAICRGVPLKLSGTIDLPLLKHMDKTGWEVRVSDDEKAKPAITTYRVLGRTDDLCWIECKPKTGRTHQIRVHLAAIGAPILGDPRYGDLSIADRDYPMMLHAHAVSFPLSSNKPPIDVIALPPDEMAAMLEQYQTA